MRAISVDTIGLKFPGLVNDLGFRRYLTTWRDVTNSDRMGVGKYDCPYCYNTPFGKFTTGTMEASITLSVPKYLCYKRNNLPAYKVSHNADLLSVEEATAGIDMIISDFEATFGPFFNVDKPLRELVKCNRIDFYTQSAYEDPQEYLNALRKLRSVLKGMRDLGTTVEWYPTEERKHTVYIKGLEMRKCRVNDSMAKRLSEQYMNTVRYEMQITDTMLAGKLIEVEKENTTLNIERARDFMNEKLPKIQATESYTELKKAGGKRKLAIVTALALYSNPHTEHILEEISGRDTFNLAKQLMKYINPTDISLHV